MTNPKKFTARDRYRYSVIDVARDLAGTATGSHGGLQIDDLREMRAWLAWRVGDGWKPSDLPGSADYDAAVRALGVAALAVIDGEQGRWLELAGRCGAVCADDPRGEFPCVLPDGHEGSHNDKRGNTWARPRGSWL